MKEVSLSGSPRQGVGKKDASALRRTGKIPCVVYGGATQTHFTVETIPAEKVVFTPNVNIINLDIEGKKTKAIIQAIQFHPVTDKIHHIDFLELNDTKKVKVEIPVKLKGRSVGVMSGGKLQQVFRKLKVQALPGDLPDSIEIDITDLKIGDAVRVKNLSSDKLNIIVPPNAVVVSVKTARGAVETAEPTAEAKPAAAAAEAKPADK